MGYRKTECATRLGVGFGFGVFGGFFWGF